MCLIIIITPTWITPTITTRRVPRGTKSTCALIAPSEFYILCVCTISPPIYHPPGVDKKPTVVFWWTSISFHRKPYSLSTFHGYYKYEDIGEFVQQWSKCWSKTWYYVSHAFNLCYLMVHRLQFEDDFFKMISSEYPLYWGSWTYFRLDPCFHNK